MADSAGIPQTSWLQLRAEAEAVADAEPALASTIHATILAHKTFAGALAYQLAHKLAGPELEALKIREICDNAYAASPEIIEQAEADMRAVMERDPACMSSVQPFLFFKGYQALQTYRVAHWLWNEGRETLAYLFQSRSSELFTIDIHPAAKIGSGVMLDHATGITIGETAVVGDDCSILQGVTLGGTGKEAGDRHPKIGRGVLLSAGAKVLGNITIGDEAKVAASSVVLKDVPSKCTVAGIPARPIGGPCCEPARNMDQTLPEGAISSGGG